jgi:hypothetical protein
MSTEPQPTIKPVGQPISLVKSQPTNDRGEVVLTQGDVNRAIAEGDKEIAQYIDAANR